MSCSLLGFGFMQRGAVALAAVIGLAALPVVQGCAKREVTRVSVETTVDLSGRWNDVDSREVSEAMIQEAFARPWITNWMEESGGRRPTVIVGVVRNQTSEHIPVGTFVGDIERAMVNSGKVNVVATAAEREDLRAERIDQWHNATEETAKMMGRELGADYMLSGTIESIMDSEGGRQVRFYQVDLTLLNIETNQKAWIGQHKIKKVIQQGRFRP